MIDDLKCLSVAKVCELLSVRRSLLHKLTRTGRFPRGIRIGGRRVWRLSDVKTWLDAQAGVPAGGGQAQ